MDTRRKKAALVVANTTHFRAIAAKHKVNADRVQGFMLPAAR